VTEAAFKIPGHRADGSKMGGGPRSRRALVAFFVVASSLAAASLTAPAPARADDTYEMYFPIIGATHYTDTFGDPRSGGRTHHGVDMMAEKMTPVIAVASGTVGWMHDEQGGDCCSMALRHDDGWESWYIHLNNDTPGTDDGQGWGFAPGITQGVHVQAGQLIGYVGDSGNAEEAGSHLHFELHQPGGVVVNPTPYVDAAIKLAEPVAAGYEGTFWDDETSVHRFDIDLIAAAGVTYGCNPPVNDQFCPQRQLTRGQITAFLRRALDLPDAQDDAFADDGWSEFEGDINALAAAGIAFGCAEQQYCPDDPLRREEMAEFLVRAFGYTNPEETDFFIDDDASPFEDSINKLKNHGITIGCNPPDNTAFCPERTLTRAEMASFLVRALGLSSD
jgi:hypothetical protein